MKNILILVFITSFFAACKNCETKMIPYQSEESYTEMEPYSSTETVEEKLTFQIEGNNIFYRRIAGLIIGGDNPKIEIKSKVTNTSDHTGEFTLYATVTSQGDKIDFNEKAFIPPGTTFEFISIKEINPLSFKANLEVSDWGIIPPTISVEKEVTKYNEVTKYRTVTKYRECNTCKENCN